MPPTRKTCLVSGLLTAGFVGAAFVGYNRTDLADDLAEYVNNPVRVLHGEMPYRDFWLLHPPGEVYLPAAVYRLGLGVNAVLLVSAAISVLTGLAAFWVGKIVSGRDADGALAAVLVFFAGVPVEYVGYVYLHAYLLLLLIAAGFLAGSLGNHRQWRLFCAGLALGCAFCFRIYLTGACAAALFATVLLESRTAKRSWRETCTRLVICGTGTLVVPVAVAALLADVWPHMWHAIAVDSVSHAVAPRVTYGYYTAEEWTDFMSAAIAFSKGPGGEILNLAGRGSMLIKTVTMHAVPLLAIFLWWHRRRNGAAVPVGIGWMISFFVLWGSLTFIRPLLRGGTAHQLSQATTPLYFALVLLLRPIVEGWQAKRTLAGKLAVCIILGAVAGLGQRAVVVPLQRVTIPCRKGRYAIMAPYGTLIADNSARGDELQRLITAVMEETRERDHIFVVPWNAPALYALTRRRNPTYYDSTIDLYYRPSAERQQNVCRALLANDTRLVIGGAGISGPASDGNGSSPLPIIDACVSEHFESFREIGRFRVWRRAKTESASGNIRAPGP